MVTHENFAQREILYHNTHTRGRNSNPYRFPPPYVLRCSLTLGMKLARTTFSLGEPIEVSITTRIPASVAIKYMEIELVQIACWVAKGKKSMAQKVLASRTAQISELDSFVHQPFSVGIRDPIDTTTTGDAKVPEVADPLLDGMSGTFVIRVPEEKLDYVLDAAGLGKARCCQNVEQFIRVRMKTGKSLKSPVLSCPIEVVNNMAPKE